MKKLIAFLLLFPGIVSAEILKWEYGTAFELCTTLYDYDNPRVAATGLTLQAADCKVTPVGGSTVNCAAGAPAEENATGAYCITLSGTVLEEDILVVSFSDAAGGPDFIDSSFTIYTYDASGNRPINSGATLSSDSIAAILDTDVEDWSSGLGSYIDTIKKYVSNRMTISGTNYTIYKDNGSTVFETGTTSNTERTPN